MLNINDVVRVIVPDYAYMSKNFYLYPDRWEESQGQLDKIAMLGGLYIIHSINKESEKRIFYKLLLNSDHHSSSVSEAALQLHRNVIDCPFKVGDKVVFSLTDDEAKNQYLWLDHPNYKFRDRSTVYTITEVLNHFYIFLDYPKGDTRSAPFRWDNFKKID